MSTPTPNKKKRKKRPSWQKLDYWQKRGMWRKQYKGKKHPLSPGKTSKNEETHALAWQQWIQLKARLDSQQRSAQDYLLGVDHTHEDTLEEMLLHVKQFAEVNNLDISLKAMLKRTWYAESLGQEGAAVNDLPAPNRVSKGLRLKALVEEFNTFMRGQAYGKQLSAARAGSLDGHLKFFLGWAGDDKTTGDVDEELVKLYHNHVLTMPGAPTTKRDRWGGFKQFVKWMAENTYCPLPANLDSKAFNFRVPPKQPKPMPTKDLKAMLGHKDMGDRLKLYLLLMIGTGMQQTDISNLNAGMFDANKGTITRVRGKTAHHAGAPTITYKLWPETLALLTKEMQAKARHDQPLLVSDKGEPLVTRPVSGGRTDRIANEWNTFKKKLGVKAPTRPLKDIRKTGATLLSHKFDNIVGNHYLADAPSGVLATNYVPPNQKKFDKALAWLRTQVI